MASFSSQETQDIKISFNVADSFSMHPYGDAENLATEIAYTVVQNCSGDINDWEIIDCDFGDDIIIESGIVYTIIVNCFVSVTGTCYYDPGRYSGRMEDCYPEEIDDVQYEDGMIDGCDTAKALSELTGIADLSVTIGPISEDGEIEISDDYDDWEDDRYEPDWDD